MAKIKIGSMNLEVEMHRASKAIRSVLVVGVDEGPMQRIEPLLHRADFELDRVPFASMAESLIQSVPFDVILGEFSGDEEEARELMQLIRAEDSPCCRSAILWVSEPDEVELAERLIDGGYTRVISTDASDEDLEEEVSALLRVAPRLAVRLPIRLEICFADGHTQTFSQTDNVSKGGMLVRIRQSVDIGSEVEFELLPSGGGGPIRGRARAVRHAVNQQQRVFGVGFQFIEFLHDGEERVQKLIEEAKDS